MPARRLAPALSLLGLLQGAAASAQEPAEEVVEVTDRYPSAVPPGRAASVVGREELAERLPRSAPAALHWEPGVYIQQTAHGQASAFVRGRTGQQTVLLFDGIRLNNATWRQGPNQYFFTVDARSIHRIEVMRGGASTRYGSDAIGGVIAAHPITPRLGAPGLEAHPAVSARAATADDELGGRAQLELRGERVGFLGGAGYRDVGRLESGGPITSPATGQPPEVPRLEADGRTQLGTGFRELASDARLVLALGPSLLLTAAAYDYRQLDAPRTDQCPPPQAPFDHCLTYDEQFRTLGYLRADGGLGAPAAAFHATLSVQRQHERRTQARPQSFVENGGRDDVLTLGGTVQAETAPLAGGAVLRYGGDLYHDRVGSDAWLTFTDVRQVVTQSRGQYLSGSRYTAGGAWLEAQLPAAPGLVARAGGRASAIRVTAPADPESGSARVDRTFAPVAGSAGLEWQAHPALALLAGADLSFRAPNLDDLTSRQQTGPGFQFENPRLGPERALSVEAGLRGGGESIRVEAWVFHASMWDAITRSPRDPAACPPATPQCQASWSRLQLENLDGAASLFGAEGSLLLTPIRTLRARLTVAWARGEDARGEPLSRVPPANGSAELRWSDERLGLSAGAGVRWALLQDRLAPSDRSDARIPTGGTPGYVVVEARLGYQLRERLQAQLVLENLGDAAYRHHGSSTNGAGRGMVLQVELAH